jgi:hypothetical protein
MRDKDEPEIKEEDPKQSADAGQPEKREEKRKAYDTLSDENPLICRGVD